MTKRPDRPSHAISRILLDDAPVTVLEMPDSTLKSPIFDDAKQIAALPANLEDRSARES